MSKVFRSVFRVFKGALTAFQRYPASIGCAVAFAAVTMVRIQLDWQQQEPFNFLFNCLHWSLALGALSGLAAAIFTSARFGTKKTFVLANLFSLVTAAVAFLLLYFLSRINMPDYQYGVISNVAQVRVSALLFISLVLFVLFAGYRDGRSEFDLSLFMAEKAFFISLIYGLVIFAGASGVASAVEFLIYSNMSEKVYMYIGTLSGLIGFLLFVGYFPDFTKDAVDPKREQAQHQPRFIEILFSYIMIPLVLALTLVLIAWTGRTVFSGMHVRFIQLYSIAAVYTVGGLWLHAMTIRSESTPARIYRIVYPIASFLILLFEAWAVVYQLLDTGLKTTEYIFILLWLLAFSGSILILAKKIRAHVFVALTACILAVVSVLPAVGYQALPVTAQTSRLEALLVSQDMLEGDAITPAEAEPGTDVKEAITDAVYYLIDERQATLPDWFDTAKISAQTFKDVFGFDPAWPTMDTYDSTGVGEYRGIYLSLDAMAMPVDDYDWVVTFNNRADNESAILFTGQNGDYEINWYAESYEQAPTISIALNGQRVVEQSLDAYIDGLTARYGFNNKGEINGNLENMSILFETDSFDALLVLNYAEFSFSTVSDDVSYWVEPGALYITEKTVG